MFVFSQVLLLKLKHNYFKKLSALLFIIAFYSNTKTVYGQNFIHVFVPLCDNKYQGIVPVPSKIGNGQDLKNNLYWGCGYGVKMFFKNKSKQWKFLKSILNPSTNVLERCVFKHNLTNTYLIADAYDGQFIKNCTEKFLEALSGKNKDSLTIDNQLIYFGGNAQLICYTGHNGLMDFNCTSTYKSVDTKKRNCIILACYSKSYFSSHIQNIGAMPLVWSTHLMSPEAYTLEASINAWLAKKTNIEIREEAAKAYSKYQKSCSLNSAKKLLVTGF